MRLRQRLLSAFLFVLPFAVLLALWAVLVPYFNVNPRLFPQLGTVWDAGVEGMRDGTLPAHIGASLLRVLVGTILALALAIIGQRGPGSLVSGTAPPPAGTTSGDLRLYGKAFAADKFPPWRVHVDR